MAEYHRQGYSINYASVVDVDIPLSTAVYKYMGGEHAWAKALIAIGHDPKKMMRDARRQARLYPNKETVIQGIKRRLRKRMPVHSASLQRSKNSDMSLLIRGTELFGSWNNALNAVGLDPVRITREAVSSAVHKRRRRKDGTFRS